MNVTALVFLFRLELVTTQVPSLPVVQPAPPEPADHVPTTDGLHGLLRYDAYEKQCAEEGR